VFAFTTRAARSFADVAYHRDDAFLFGPEIAACRIDIDTLPPERRLKIQCMQIAQPESFECSVDRHTRRGARSAWVLLTAKSQKARQCWTAALLFRCRSA
jgi:hypothetical protein